MILIPEQIAQVACNAITTFERLLGDEALLMWESLPASTQHVWIDDTKFVLANPEAGDGGLHQAWMDAKLLDGWKWAETLDRGGKRHPNLVPFDELPAAQQQKDRLFRAVVLSFVEG